MNGHAPPKHATKRKTRTEIEIDMLNKQLVHSQKYAKFHGDPLLGDKILSWSTMLNDMRKVITFKNMPEIMTVIKSYIGGKGLDISAGAQLVGALPNNSKARAGFIETQVQAKYDKMLHPPLSYLGDAFQFRTADGRFNSAIHPHLGQGNSPYAKTVPSKTHSLGALPDPGDLFDRLMAREEGGRTSTSGLSAMLIYHATIIIHDIFRTNDNDKNISDSSSYLDLSPLYGYTDKMQREIRDDKYKLGLLKPDTFAEDRLLRQPAGVCIMLVMYNRYHNYAATQLRRINENGRFQVPSQYAHPKLASMAKRLVLPKDQDEHFHRVVKTYIKEYEHDQAHGEVGSESYKKSEQAIEDLLKSVSAEAQAKFTKDFDAAWDKLDEDLFQTARLITCGIYIQISIHDYLRALMGFHQFKTDFTLDPRVAMTEHRNVSRGLGNQVTVEFNLLYRFHCAISLKDENYAEDYMREYFGDLVGRDWDPKNMQLPEFLRNMQMAGIRDKQEGKETPKPWEQTFGLKSKEDLNFTRNPITGLFDDQKMINEMTRAMDDPISNFGPRNVPRSLKAVEIMGIMQARKWEVGSLNDFRDFFGMKRHETFESITGDEDVQTALRDLYDHPDQVELYPGIFCESDANKNADPGPSGLDSALWSAIFSDAITLVRSDRFYTVDWNTKNLTSWGMAEVTPDDSDILKSSVFHRLIQRAFPGWFPYDSIHFFHPFYTSQTNAKYAQEQGFANNFRFTPEEPKVSKKDPKAEPTFNTKASQPEKPWKPVYLKKYDEIKALLKDESDNFVHPARLALDDLPTKVKDILKPKLVDPLEKKKKKKHSSDNPTYDKEFEETSEDLKKYFADLSLDIVRRESILMDVRRDPKFMDGQDRRWQIDATRDFAIPITTRYVADFLGFGHLLRSDTNPSAPYSENEIYEHITNCQIFLTYNADETKLLKRRAAFRSSMNFLYGLTTQANILEANRWTPVRWARKRLSILFGRHTTNPMTELGFKVAQQILHHEKDAGRSAAVLLLVGLDTAYNSVLAFTSVLNHFILRLYDTSRGVTVTKEDSWLALQELAYSGTTDDFESLKAFVLDAQRKSVRLPIIRRVMNDGWIGEGVLEHPIEVKQGETVICDISKVDLPKPKTPDEHDYLTYTSSFTSRFAHYHPKHVAVLGLTSMIKVLAQTKNLRPGHDAQGRLKRVNLDTSYEGYSNFMAPGRMSKIEAEVEALVRNSEDKTKARKEAAKIFTKDVLKPKTDTYLTPEWDEFVPFPTTWKVRYDGFGKSDYGGPGYPNLHKQFDTSTFEQAPWYQPRGPSHTGGSFAIPVCVCNTPGLECKCKDEQAKRNQEEAAKEKAEEDAKKKIAGAIAAHAGPLTEAEGLPLKVGFTSGCGMTAQVRH